MDPKSSAQLDPKLQEAYNRVMGVNLTASSDPATPAPTNSSTPTDTPTVPGNPVAQQDPTTPAIQPTPQDPTAMPDPAPMPSPAATPDPTAAPAVPMADPTTPADPAPTEQKTEDKPAEIVDTPITPAEPAMPSMESTVNAKSHAFVAKGNGMKVSPVIIAVGGIAFLLIYSLVWIKVFNLSIPFINQ